jgi:hypothetical protein
MDLDLAQKDTRKEDEIALFKELGLQTQVSLREIQTVMAGQPYYQVTDKELEKLFGMRWIKLLTWWHNQGVRSEFAPKSTFVCVLLLLASIACATIAVSVRGEAWFLVIASFFSALVCAAINDTERDPRSGLLVAELKKEDIFSTSIKIPLGAALRYQEAKESKLFEQFAVVYPNVIEQQITRDPAILGLRRSQRSNSWGGTEWDQYMIVYWDLEKDQARAIKQIKDFGKFKVKA